MNNSNNYWNAKQEYCDYSRMYHTDYFNIKCMNVFVLAASLSCVCVCVCKNAFLLSSVGISADKAAILSFFPLFASFPRHFCAHHFLSSFPCLSLAYISSFILLSFSPLSFSDCVLSLFVLKESFPNPFIRLNSMLFHHYLYFTLCSLALQHFVIKIV